MTQRSPQKGSADPDPVGELRFTVSLPGVSLGTFRECSGIGVEVETMDYQEGGNNEYVHQLRGRIRYPNVVLGRGITHEDELLRWLFTAEPPSQRPTVTITMNDPTGKAVRVFALAAALPVRWTGPSSQTGSNGSATESLEISHAGLV